MKNIFTFLARHQSLIYKAFLFILTTALIIFLLPKGGHFKYTIQKGKPWQYENLYAPFSFVVKKDKKTIEKEKQTIIDNATPYFDLDTDIVDNVKIQFERLIDQSYNDSLYLSSKNKIKHTGLKIIQDIYKNGLLNAVLVYNPDKIVYLKENNSLKETRYGDIVKLDDVEKIIDVGIKKNNLYDAETLLNETISSVIVPNARFNKTLTQNDIDTKIKKINPNKGVIDKGARIIAKGEVVEGDKLQILNSLKTEYQSKIWSESNYAWLIIGYSMLIFLVFLMLFLFLDKYRPEIFKNNLKVTFIFVNIIFIVFLTTLVIKFNASYVYVVPIPILPLVLKTFFDARLGLFVHVLTLLLLGFIVPNSFEFLFLQIIAGIVTILTVKELHKRANLFISVGQITLVYMLGYLAFSIIQEGNIKSLEWLNFGYFVLCGLITLFAFPLVYVYEKVFGLVSDVSLLELSDTNSKLLKELSNKAPGTFHHSLNVANLAEAAANEIGANAMLVRVGALFHDIGKMENPTFFTENQLNGINSHDDLAPKESAQLIIGHVIKGIEIARKNKLPDRVIDFIRTHHGTNVVYYFYKTELDRNGTANKDDFKYPGPIPFSKETAILMMADSVEAASKSLKEPTSSKIEAFVENIINKQLEQKQFQNANITLKEIEDIKKVLKKKLNNMYHLRIEYPE